MVHVVNTAGAQAMATDFVQSFVLAGGAFRGRLVRLSKSISDIIARHDDPEPIATLLCDAMTGAVALSSGIKYDGVFTLQAQGKGAVQTLVADVTSAGELRAWARYDADALSKAMRQSTPEHLAAHLLGEGYLAFTVDQGPDTERYQGVVELVGGSIADSVHNYFRQSEQLASALLTVVQPPAVAGGYWHSAAMLIQRMPDIGGRPALTTDDAEDAWRTAVVLMGSVTKAELLDQGLATEQLLYRLFATIGVAPLKTKPIHFACRCSRDRSRRILASFPVEEVTTYAEQGIVRMTCEFCRTNYEFPVAELVATAVEPIRDHQNEE